MYKALTVVLLTIAILTSCSSGNFEETPKDLFNGKWELKGRDVFNGIKVEISTDQKGRTTGKVIELNDNKYVNLFVEIGDVWLTDIKRNSNYEFLIFEKKIAAPLFSLYGNNTTKEWRAIFKNDNCFAISEGKNVERSPIQYCRITE